MLTHLYIKNFTIIDTLDIDFQQGFSVITGETGAGKSIILGAINQLLGQRADVKNIRNGQKQCVIEGIFNVKGYDLESIFEENDIDFFEECTLRREISNTGKSRSFINDCSVSLNVMKDVGEKLIDIHSQHQNLLISKDDFQLNVIDIIAKNSDVFNKYKSIFLQYKQAEKELNVLKEEAKQNKINEDFLRFQYEELMSASLKEGEQAELEEENEVMSNAEEIKNALYQATENLSGEHGTIHTIRQETKNLDDIQNVYSAITPLIERLDAAYIELKDIAEELDNKLYSIDYNPDRLQKISEKLDKIYNLQHKHQVNSVEELISIRNNLGKKLENIDNFETQLTESENKVKDLFEQVNTLANKLSATRKSVIQQTENNIVSHLVPLGIPSANFKINIEQKELTPNGFDKVEFLFTANKSTNLMPVAKVASGGEIARLMLSIKAIISCNVNGPTIIFDEIDTGTSGKVAEKIADTMSEMANNNHQVISITHLPQIAAKGKYHYTVYKKDTEDSTVSSMKQLSKEDRIKEIATMLSGSDITNAAIENAKQLLITT